MKKTIKVFGMFAAVAMFSTVAFALLNYFQGFEVNVSGWTVDQGITRVASGGGALHPTASSGNYYAEIQNLHDNYGYPVTAPGGSSFYGGADSVYHGDFYQAIDVYINANWAPAAAAYSPSFWIDMTPYHADLNNYGAEHNFRLTATGSAVIVTVDGMTAPTASAHAIRLVYLPDDLEEGYKSE